MNNIDTIVANLLFERTQWLRRWMDPRRNIDAECGHPTSLTIEDYLYLFRRGDIAARIVSIWPDESWSQDPLVYETEAVEETEFEQAWNKLLEEFPVYSILHRADVLSGIGRFGIVLIGIDDGKDLSEPADSNTESKVLYLRVFDESLVRITKLVSDPSDPRYGLPEFYSISFSETTDETTTVSRQVHWSRVVHIADNRTSSEIYGIPRLEKVINRIYDLHKVVSGSAEMFWKGGFPGLSLETHPNVTDADLDIESIRKQVEAYMNGLQRYLATVGMEAKSLPVEVADPSPHAEIQLKLIASALGVPWRVFVGSESAQLASEQDIRTWNRRVSRRRQEYLTPYVVRPFVRRLVELGVLPEPQHIIVDWPDLESPGDKDKAQIAELKATALAKYMTSGAEAVMDPFYFFTLVMGLSDEEARAVVEDRMKMLEGEISAEEPTQG